MFLVVDEAEVRSKKYVDNLAGILEEPNKTYLIACKPLSRNPSSSVICTIMDNSLKEMIVARENFLLGLLLSDAARYMLKAARSLKLCILVCFP